MDEVGWLNPEQFWAHMGDLDEQMRAAAHLMPLYGVAGWTGPVMTGDWEWYNDELAVAELAHGDPLGDGPFIAVATTTGETGHDGPPGRRDPLGLRPEGEILAAGAEHTDAGTTQISVDGQPVGVAWRRDDQAWYATGGLGGHRLRIETRHTTPDQVDLVRIVDIEPYLAGRRSFLRAARGET